MLFGIFTNCVSQAIFVFLLAFTLWFWNSVSRHTRIGKARQFFGFQQQTQIKIYVSGFVHPGVKTRTVVTALEYEAAVEMRETLRQLPRREVVDRIVDFLVRLIGQSIQYPEPDIEVSPLDEVKEQPYTGSTILIGGPVANQLSRFYLQDHPRFRFNESARKYQRRDGEEYRDIDPSTEVAVIEKRIIGEQVVILIHGFGEEQTGRAVRHLINNWEELYRQHGTQEFGVCV